MKKIPQISEAERVVMQVLWSEGPFTANEIVAKLKGKVKWSPRTIRTLINRLLNKHALDFDKEGKEYIYFHTVTEKQCIKHERISFLKRVYGGATKPMIAAFIEDAKLSKSDIAEIKTMLEQKGKGK
ncbi:MAG TPA: BlaI/MecI/CopY family transcriptional regulator [Sedimentisphaerales bacterium]|nr:BlaI/MecI/CopY family transcriptional regulator [Sedimentisphaerales bacterium]